MLKVAPNIKDLIERSKEKWIRGVFVPAENIMYQLRRTYEDNFKYEDIHITRKQLQSIANNLPCPCGNCKYYTVELFDNGKWVSHHHVEGVVQSGDFNTGKVFNQYYDDDYDDDYEPDHH